MSLAWSTTLYLGFKERREFRHIQAYCMFIGYPRSGHSLVGSLLDAHHNVVIAHELDVLGFLQRGFRRHQLYALILNNSRAIARAGRQQTGYPYEVPGSWQGRFDRLTVIGDKRGMTSMRRLQRHPELLPRLQRVVRDPIRFVHVIRNPFDNITTMSKRMSTPLPETADTYFSLCQTVSDIKRRVGADKVFDIRHEALIAGPRKQLEAMCSFMGVSPDGQYLDSCASIVFTSPRKTRHEGPWTDELVASVQERIGRFEFLAGYDWDG